MGPNQDHRDSRNSFKGLQESQLVSTIFGDSKRLPWRGELSIHPNARSRGVRVSSEICLALSSHLSLLEMDPGTGPEEPSSLSFKTSPGVMSISLY